MSAIAGTMRRLLEEAPSCHPGGRRFEVKLVGGAVCLFDKEAAADAKLARSWHVDIYSDFVVEGPPYAHFNEFLRAVSDEMTTLVARAHAAATAGSYPVAGRWRKWGRCAFAHPCKS